MYKNNQEVVEAFDYYIGSMTREVSKRITISLISEKIGIQYEVAKQMLLEYEKFGILEKRIAVTCPICGQMLQNVKETELYESLEEATYCINCEDENIVVTQENLFVVFMRKKLYTSSQDEVNRTLIQHNTIIDVIPNGDYFFYKADLLSTDDLLGLFSVVNESALQIIKSKYEALDGVFSNTTEKGHAYDNLIKEVFSTVKGIDTTNILKSDTNQIDGFIVTYINTVFPSILNVMAPAFYCECKNEPDNPPDITYYQKLHSIVEKSKVARLGIIFSRVRATSDAKLFGKQVFLLNDIALININDDDWDKIINNEMTILKLISIKYAEVLSYAKEQIDLIKEFSN
jgi:hypothetical protein